MRRDPMSNDAPPRADPALEPYLSAAGEEEARERLGDLLAGIAAPLVKRVIRRQLGGRGGGVPEPDLEDLHSTTLMRLQLHLSSVRAGDNPPMASFADYVAVTAFNSCSAYLMAREPERTRLRHRVRYVLRKDPRLATWTGPAHESVCGLAAWEGRTAEVDPGRLEALAADVVAGQGREPARLGAQVRAIVAAYGAPCRFESLVNALAAALDVHDEAPAPLAAEEEATPVRRRRAPELADGAPTALAALEARQALEQLWAEILELLPNQRTALLLNLRDDGGGDMFGALLAAGLAPPEEVAASLGLDGAELSSLLPELPLEDLRIAERLGLTRQQVINLRKSARLRLGRRMRGLLPGMGG
jgi:hypothetical protein